MKRKFIERSKNLSIRVPISKYSEIKKMFKEILNKFCRDNNLFTPEKNND